MPTHLSFRRKRGASEDGAGWIYADLFLALTIVGLGSAIITTGNASGSVASVSSTTTPTETTLPAFRLSCVEFGIGLPRSIVDKGSASIGAAIQAGVALEIAARGWNEPQAKPGLVILAGGFDEGQIHGDGALLAQKQEPIVRSSTSLLKGVEMRTSGARFLSVNGERVKVGDAGDFLLVVYLVYGGPAVEENCEK